MKVIQFPVSIYVSNNVWKESVQKGACRLVLLCLADFADHKGKCWPSQATIAERCQLTRNGVQKALAKLISDGDVVIVQQGGIFDGKKTSTTYRISNRYWPEKGQQRIPKKGIQQSPNRHTESGTNHHSSNLNTPEQNFHDLPDEDKAEITSPITEFLAKMRGTPAVPEIIPISREEDDALIRRIFHKQSA